MNIVNINELKLANIDYIDIYNNQLKHKVEQGIHLKIPLKDIKIELCKSHIDPTQMQINININNNNFPNIKNVNKNEIGSINIIPFNKKNENLLYIEGLNVIDYDIDSLDNSTKIQITINQKESKTLLNKYLKAEKFLNIKYKQKIKTTEIVDFFQTNKIIDKQKKLLEQVMYIIAKIEEKENIEKLHLDDSFKNLFFNFESFNQKDFLFKYELFIHDYISLLEELSYAWELKNAENETMSALDYFNEINNKYFNFDLNFNELINYHESIKYKHLFLLKNNPKKEKINEHELIYSNFFSYKDILKEFNNQLSKLKQL